MKYKIMLLLLALLVFVASCAGSDEPEPTVTTIPMVATPTAASATVVPIVPTPALESTTVSPLAAPQSPLAAPQSPLAAPAGSAPVLPEPATGKATFAGRLIAQFGEKDILEPVMLSAVYLAPVILDEDKMPVVARLDSVHDPNSGTDGNGYFVFEDVPPGQYGFVVFYNLTHYLIRDEAGEQVLMDIKANEVKDIGDLKTNLPE